MRSRIVAFIVAGALMASAISCESRSFGPTSPSGEPLPSPQQTPPVDGTSVLSMTVGGQPFLWWIISLSPSIGDQDIDPAEGLRFTTMCSAPASTVRSMYLTFAYSNGEGTSDLWVYPTGGGGVGCSTTASAPETGGVIPMFAWDRPRNFLWLKFSVWANSGLVYAEPDRPPDGVIYQYVNWKLKCRQANSSWDMCLGVGLQ